MIDQINRDVQRLKTMTGWLDTLVDQIHESGKRASDDDFADEIVANLIAAESLLKTFDDLKFETLFGEATVTLVRGALESILKALQHSRAAAITGSEHELQASRDAWAQAHALNTEFRTALHVAIAVFREGVAH